MQESNSRLVYTTDAGRISETAGRGAAAKG